MQIKSILLSWDLISSVTLTLITAWFLPTMLKISFCVSSYNIGITVLSIVFSLFFAALAIIMTSSDNDFIQFLEAENDFTALLNTFKVTLLMLFLGLIYSIILFISSDCISKENGDTALQHKIWFLIFEFLFTYGLFATALSVKDTIKFSEIRVKYLKINKRK